MTPVRRTAPKPAAPIKSQSNGVEILTDTRSQTLSVNQNVENDAQGRIRNTMMTSMFQKQFNQQQQTIVRAHNTHSTAATSKTVTSSTVTSSSSSKPVIPVRSELIKLVTTMLHWQDELMEFSNQLTRQSHVTLSRIANHFRANGMKFDADFRNHFLYIANNRILESFDSFLIGLPRDMKSDEYEVQRPQPSTYVRKRIVADQQQLDEPSAKRKRIENGNEHDTNGATKTSQIAVIKRAPPTYLPRNLRKLGSQLVIQKVAGKQSTNAATTTTTTTTAAPPALANNVLKIKNVTSLQRSTAVTATDPLNISIPNGVPPKEKTIANAQNEPEKNSVKKIRILSKIPGKQMKVFIPITSSTPNKPSNTLKLTNLAPEDPLKFDGQIENSATEAKNNTGIEHPKAIVKRMAVMKTGIQLSTSLPIASSSASVTLPTEKNGILTRSRRTKPLYKCDSCAFTTEVDENFLRHRLIHTVEKAQVCKTCKKRFPRKPLLIAHLRDNHHELHSDLAYWDTD